ncbi:type II/IV secretion system protein [Undibacterium sp. CY7W]|uniref:Type II/IV secretion system protein n=1 Tax=Undibacterium rugosum TaxID=2762291 RepID=A0A923KZ92_9BURK|nr:GspE/PulE family protein [Undibacterium rugosum]MBC3935643.1 type II/IV secretion system protein [Undibacterium rugosum]
MIAPLDWAFDEKILTRARSLAQSSGQSLFSSLQELTGQEQRTLIKVVASLFDLVPIETEEMMSLPPAFDLVSLSKSMQRQCALLRVRENTQQNVIGIITDPFDTDLMIWLETQATSYISYRLALPSDLAAYLTKQEESVRAVDHMENAAKSEQQLESTIEVLSFSSISESSSPAVKLVNSTLYDALKAGASDIHLESTASGLLVKYRIDGILDNATSAQGIENAEQVISRIKVLAELDIAERRVPQDGSFQVQSGGREIDLRVSIMPSIHGEDAVIRILDKRSMVEEYGSLTLDALNFDSSSLTTLRQLAEEPYGMLLVTGPTGSGKTTTLYAALTEINSGRDKIITIEDPVEYQLPGILQIPVNEKKGLSFAKGLRSILRHDPDKIMVGEIRDRETAEIAIQSALTGHLVLTTVHANNVFDVFGRFTHMGIDPYAFVSALNGVWAQRLIRLNCPHCSRAYRPDSQELSLMQTDVEHINDFTLKKGNGCGDCRGTGYKGRRAIAEILTLTDEIREMIIEKKPIRQIKNMARMNGTRSLRETALELVKKGETTLEEIKRVTLNA